MNKLEDIKIWKKSIELAKNFYWLIQENKKIKQYHSLQDQFKRSCISISSNIAKLFWRKTNAEFSRFIDITLWNLFEFKNQLYLLKEINYIDQQIFSNFLEKTEYLEYMIKSLIKHLNSC